MTPEQRHAQQIANRKRLIITALDLDPKLVEALDLFLTHSGLLQQPRIEDHLRGLLLHFIDAGLREMTPRKVTDPAVAQRITDLLDKCEAEGEGEIERQGTA
jgi:hypothetical protein